MAKATPAQVQAAYLEILGRPADPDGADFYTGKDLDSVIADLQYAAATGVEDVQANRASYETVPITLPTRTQDTTPVPATVAQPVTYAQPAPAETLLERNPFFETYTPRSDVNYDELFTARSLDQNGTAPTAESINEAFETFYNRPADMPGIQGYLNSGKSIEQIRADLAYSALYSPELGLSKDVEYYEAPSATQLQYIQNLGGGTPTSTREDAFSYVEPSVMTADEVRQIYTNQFGYEPTQQDIEYWTTVYPMSPEARMSGNPKQQTINAMLVGSELPQYQYLKTDTELADTRGQAPIYTGTPMNPAQLANQTGYIHYRTALPNQTAAPFGGYFEEGFNPFNYTGIAPTPLTYTGYDPTSVQYQSDLANLSQFSPPMVTAPVETPAGEDQGIAAVVPGTT